MSACIARFVLDIIRVFQGSFGGQTVYQNPSYVSPNQARHAASAVRGGKYKSRVDAEGERRKRLKTQELEPNPLASVFKLPEEAADDDTE